MGVAWGREAGRLKDSPALTTDTGKRKKPLGWWGHQRRKQKFVPCRLWSHHCLNSPVPWTIHPQWVKGERGPHLLQNSVTGEVAFSAVAFREPLVLWNSRSALWAARGQEQEKITGQCDQRVGELWRLEGRCLELKLSKQNSLTMRHEDIITSSNPWHPSHFSAADGVGVGWRGWVIGCTF